MNLDESHFIHNNIFNLDGIFFWMNPMFQTCTVDLAIRNLEQSLLVMTPGEIGLEREETLTQYIIQSWVLTYRNPGYCEL